MEKYKKERMMVVINGEKLDIDGMLLLTYLEENNYPLERIAVEINEEIVPKSQYDTVVLNDGDTVEVVSFVGGG
ncbi:MAG: sulfur carrier protein ThiS [Agathobacter sp.]|nr:sulfur carrier protein ThiS [Agathobacter sp.]